MVRKYVSHDGRTRFQGGKDLKASQAYPPGFGRAVYGLQHDNMHLIQESAHTAAALNQNDFAVNEAMYASQAACVNRSWPKSGGFESVAAFLASCSHR